MFFCPAQALAPVTAQNGNFIMAQNTAMGPMNVYTDPNLHLQVLYSTQQTPFRANMQCSTV